MTLQICETCDGRGNVPYGKTHVQVACPDCVKIPPSPPPLDPTESSEEIKAKLSVLKPDTQTLHTDLLKQLRESEAQLREEGHRIDGWALVVTYQDGNVSIEQYHTSEKTWNLIGALQGAVHRMIQSLQLPER